MKASEQSLDRNNSVFNRKELIKKEYNRIMDQRLPNILSQMNQDKHVIAAHESSLLCDIGGSNMIGNGNIPYDETDLLSKMFTKDH
jgi:hypothetical protein